jgi:D-glycero-alpha-D-manno-heptose 1-phosphate guanylyltransferase
LDLIILAGGFGTRMQAVSQGTPKALLPVGDKVFLDKILSKIARLDVSQIYLSLYYKPELFEEYLRHCDYHVDITPLIEPEPLGTGGAIKYIIENTSISDPFFVLNGDTLSNTNLDKMNDRFFKRNYDALVGISHVESASRYGTVKVESDRLVFFSEKGSSSYGWINNGHYILKQDVFNNLSGNFSIEYDVFPNQAEKNRLGVFKVYNDNFIDMGIPEDYEKLCKMLEV